MNSFEAPRMREHHDMVRPMPKGIEGSLTRVIRNTEQNLPKKASNLIRGGIIAKPGRVLVTADFASQEVRILAAYSRDESLLKAYNPCGFCEKAKGKFLQFDTCPHKNSGCKIIDIHSLVTKMVFPKIVTCEIEEVKALHDALRDNCKACTFSLIYGGGPSGVASKFKITLDEAKQVMLDYFNAFPGIRGYIESVKDFVQEHGYIIDMCGRVRKFHNTGWRIPSRSHMFQSCYNQHTDTYFKRAKPEFRQFVSADCRAGINMPIQGLAASMTKIACNNLYGLIKQNGIDMVIAGYIHDEVFTSVLDDKDSVRTAAKLIRQAMVDDINMPNWAIKNHPLGWTWPEELPMDVDIKVGYNWSSLVKLKDFLK